MANEDKWKVEFYFGDTEDDVQVSPHGAEYFDKLEDAEKFLNDANSAGDTVLQPFGHPTFGEDPFCIWKIRA